MASSEDVMVYFKAKDEVSPAMNTMSSKASAMKTAIGGAMTAIGASLVSFGKDAVTEAVSAESKWNRFSSSISSQGINWSTQGDNIKSYMQTFSDSMGRTVGDTRDASTALMNYGLSWNETKTAMTSVAGLAAMTGSSEADASKMLISALNGRGMAFEKATGLEIDNYKAADGSIDRAKLFADLTKKSKPFAMKFATSDEAKLNQLEGALKGVKIAVGQGLLAVISPLVPVITALARAFTSLPGPVKGAASGVVLLGGAFMLIAGPIQSVIGIMEMMSVTAGTTGGVMSALSGILGVNESVMMGEMTATEANVMAGMQWLEVTEANTVSKGGLLATIVAETGATVANTITKGANIGLALLGSTANFELAGSFGVAASAAWALTAALLANPFVLIAIVIVAVVVAVYELGKAFGWWSNVNDVLAAITAGVKRLWAAFSNDPNVKAVIDGIKSAWNGLMQIINPIIAGAKKLWNSLAPDIGGKFDVVATIIDFFRGVSNVISTVVSAFQRFNAATGILTAAFNIITTPIRAVVSAFQTIICIILGCSPGVIPALQKLGGAFSSALGGVIGFVTSFAARVVSGFLNIINGVKQLPSKSWSVLMLAIQKFVQFNAKIRATALKVGMDILNGIINNIKTLPTKLWSLLIKTISKITSFSSKSHTVAIKAGLNILHGVVNYVKQLPANIATWFNNTVSKVLGFVGTALSAATSVGLQLLNGVINEVKGIPQKVYNEFKGIATKVISVGGELYNAAQTAAQKLWDGFNNILQQHSPGIFMRAMEREFKGISTVISNENQNGYNSAQNYSKSLLNGFGNPKFKVGTSVDKSLNNLTASRTDLNKTANSLPMLNKGIQNKTGANKTIINHFQSGAFSLDARNLTQEECQQMIILGTEGLNMKSGTTKKVV